MLNLILLTIIMSNDILCDDNLLRSIFMKRHRKKSKNGRKIFIILIIIFLCIAFIKVKEQKDVNSDSNSSQSNSYNQYSSSESSSSEPLTASEMVAEFAEENGIPIEAWPPELIERLDKNPETKDFVLNYPLKKDSEPTINLDEYKNCDSVPLLLQWDERWGYNEYAGDLMGLSGCGPTALSMVCIYLLNDVKYSPKYIADFAEANGYSSPGNGSLWSLIYEGGEQLGLNVTEIPLNEDRIINNLKAGNPIICIMGPGDFTDEGHFIVMTGYDDGFVYINDPNSRANSQKEWELSSIIGQIKNLWVCST